MWPKAPSFGCGSSTSAPRARSGGSCSMQVLDVLHARPRRCPPPAASATSAWSSCSRVHSRDRPTAGQRARRASLRCIEQADGHPAILAARRIDVLAAARSGSALPMRRGAYAALRRHDGRAHLLHADLVHRGIDMAAAALLAPLRQRRGDAGRHHVRHDHIAIGHGTRNHRIAIRPARQQGAARQRAAGAIHAPLAAPAGRSGHTRCPTPSRCQGWRADSCA